MVNLPECSRWSEVFDPWMSGATDDKVIRKETSAGPETDLCGPGLSQSNHNKGLMAGRDPDSVYHSSSRPNDCFRRANEVPPNPHNLAPWA